MSKYFYENRFDESTRKRLFGEALKTRRKELNLTQADIADLTGIKIATYSSYETGTAQPTLENLVRLSFALECSVDLLVQKDNLVGDFKTQMETLETQKKDVAELLENPKVKGNPILRDMVGKIGSLLETLDNVIQEQKK